MVTKPPWRLWLVHWVPSRLYPAIWGCIQRKPWVWLPRETCKFWGFRWSSKQKEVCYKGAREKNNSSIIRGAFQKTRPWLIIIRIRGEIAWYQSNHKHIEHTSMWTMLGVRVPTLLQPCSLFPSLYHHIDKAYGINISLPPYSNMLVVLTYLCLWLLATLIYHIVSNIYNTIIYVSSTS